MNMSRVYRGIVEGLTERLTLGARHMATAEIKAFATPIATADGGHLTFSTYHVVVTTDDGVKFRHFAGFKGWSETTDIDGNTIIVRKVKPAVERVLKLKARIDAALEENDIYGLNRAYWDII